jgi:choline dehydrogenase-like flavoprotein
MTAGGGTRVYGAQAWRFCPEDFLMASTYGVPEGSALSDWPITYDDLEPFYARAEREIGVSGAAGGDPWAGFRSSDFPMAPLPMTRAGNLLHDGADSLGISAVPVPLLINSSDYGGRSGCMRCGACIGFSCPVEAKNGSHNTVIVRAMETGRCSMLLNSTAARLVTDGAGRVTGVVVVGEVDGLTWRRDVSASEVVVAAGAIETARLLLNSASDREPDGIGNNSDQVGRYLQGHLYGGATGIFDEVVVDGLGPGPAVATCDFRHGNSGLVGGGMIANEFVPTPVTAYGQLVESGLIPRHGVESKRQMRLAYPRMQRITGPVHEVSTADARVTVDPAVRDRHGLPVARLSGRLHLEDLRTQAFLSERSAEWLAASGATAVAPFAAPPADMVLSNGTHQAGTCRMGSDPAKSVTDPWGRIWGHGNVRVVDASLHVTNAGVNPVLTIFANAFRIAENIIGA